MLKICREKQVQLSRQYQQGTLAHAILIQGIEGSGKDALATWLIELLICQQPLSTINTPNVDTISQACGQCKSCLLRKSTTYPDYLLLRSDNKTLGVDDIRRGNAFLEKTAHLGKTKTILIPQAQIMTVAAANALLKTLEEPTANSYIVLVTDDIDSLLPTIISRCAVYSIRPMVGTALLAQLNVSKLNDPVISSDSSCNKELSENDFVNLSQLAELSDGNIYQEFQTFNNNFLDYLYHGKSEGLLLSQLNENTHGLRWLEKITCNLVRKHYLNKGSDLGSSLTLSHGGTVNENMISDKHISVHVLNQVYLAIINSNKLIKSYIQANRQLVSEQLLMTINNIVRP
jgi:DNA polymerase-3 subunit delta'